VTLRMPASVHQRAKGAADRERRSLNNMLVVLIEQGLDHPEDHKGGSG
jgi:predicted HicB family RNase H-like nuclease